MKTMNSKLLAMLMLGAAVTFGACSKDKEVLEPEEQIDETTLEVTFQDAGLAAFIKENLELAESAKITRGDLAKLKELNVRSVLPELNSLKGLEYATELTLLDFGNTQVSDLSPIKDLKKITYLRFNETPVTDLAPIKDYTTLTYFNANQASPGLTDISALSKNVGLKEMILRGNNIGDAGLNVIANFTKLHRLNLRTTGISNITVLGQLMAKGALLITTAGYVAGDSELDLRGNSITDHSPIQSYIDNETAVAVSK